MRKGLEGQLGFGDFECRLLRILVRLIIVRCVESDS